MRNEPKANVRRGLKVVEKVFRLPENLAQSEAGVRVSNLARTLKQPKASAYRILLTLETLGYVRQDADTMAYHCTEHAAWLTRDQANDTLRRIARSRMERLLARFEQTVNLAIFAGTRSSISKLLRGCAQSAWLPLR
jgi:DNA-binding IclR family transcriptional regulator